MQIQFFKYQGAGNDFILIDQRAENAVVLSQKQIERLCDRRFGIGADGLMLLKNHPGYDFEMQYYNADGRLGSMCGNGGRCIVAFAKQLHIIEQEANFLAVDGAHYAKISAEGNWVDLQMIDVAEIHADGEALVLNTGSPHYVLSQENLQSLNVYEAGKAIRYNDTYKQKGINVNFVEDRNDHLFVRTYERGVEDETFACGTGATAVAIAHAVRKELYGPQNIHLKVLGGNLTVCFLRRENHFTEIFLGGPATFVFKTELNPNTLV